MRVRSLTGQRPQQPAPGGNHHGPHRGSGRRETERGTRAAFRAVIVAAVPLGVPRSPHPDPPPRSAAAGCSTSCAAGGRLLPRETIVGLQRWNRIHFAGQFDVGIGLERQWVPWFLSPFRSVGDLLGFWGQSGALAFHNPQHDLTFTGTVNQLSGFGHGAAVNAMLRVIRATR